MIAEMREILIISTSDDLTKFKDLLGDGSQWGVRISYAAQNEPNGIAQAFIIGEEFIGQEPVCLVLGDNLFYGHDLAQDLLAASRQSTGATIFGYHTSHPDRYGVVEFDSEMNVSSIEEKPKIPKSNFAVPGIYFYDKNVAAIAKELRPSSRGELEITDLNKEYLRRNELKVKVLGRGTTWLDAGTPESLAAASQYVQIIQNRQGLKIACLEEIAFREGFISLDKLAGLINEMPVCDYRDYLAAVELEATRRTTR
jgi:glucose-1-phosphate thymidylyltransferase